MYFLQRLVIQFISSILQLRNIKEQLKYPRMRYEMPLTAIFTKEELHLHVNCGTDTACIRKLNPSTYKHLNRTTGLKLRNIRSHWQRFYFQGSQKNFDFRLNLGKAHTSKKLFIQGVCGYIGHQSFPIFPTKMHNEQTFDKKYLC